MVYIILSIIVMMDITHNKSLYILQVANGYDPPSFSSSLVVLARLLWLYSYNFNQMQPAIAEPNQNPCCKNMYDW